MFYYNICINNGVEAFGTEGGSIDLDRAKQIMPDEVHTEEDMVNNAGTAMVAAPRLTPPRERVLTLVLVETTAEVTTTAAVV